MSHQWILHARFVEAAGAEHTAIAAPARRAQPSGGGVQPRFRLGPEGPALLGDGAAAGAGELGAVQS